MEYSMVIRWCPEDQKYLVELPEFEGQQRFMTHGATYVEAAQHGQEVLEMLVDIYREKGKPLPKANVIDLETELSLEADVEAA